MHGTLFIGRNTGTNSIWEKRCVGQTLRMPYVAARRGGDAHLVKREQKCDRVADVDSGGGAEAEAEDESVEKLEPPARRRSHLVVGERAQCVRTDLQEGMPGGRGCAEAGRVCVSKRNCVVVHSAGRGPEARGTEGVVALE